MRDGGVPYKSGLPYKSTKDFLEVRVNRNANAPVFDPEIYRPNNFIEHFETGEIIDLITLLDPDGDEVDMYINGLNKEYFYMSDNRLQLKKSLSADLNKPNQYTVLINGNDLGSPKNPAINTATVIIRVDRNNFSPVFINAPYFGNVNRETQNGTFVTSVSWKDDDIVDPYGTVTVEVMTPAAGYAGQIFRLTNINSAVNSGEIVVYDEGLLVRDDKDEYVVWLN